MDGELNPDGSPTNHWNLCSIQQIEELKCLIRIVPVWASGIICFTAMSQQSTFTVSQARKMDRHLGPHFQIPPGSLGVISMLALTFVIPIYDRIIVPMTRRITKLPGGITLLQRIGIGMVISIDLFSFNHFTDYLVIYIYLYLWTSVDAESGCDTGLFKKLMVY